MLLQRLAPVVPTDLEVILVNNGSTDDSATVFREQLPRFPFARLVEVPKNRGYGFGILSGLRAARGEFLGWTHADLQTAPEDPVTGFSLLEKKGSTRVFLKGTRRGRPLFDQVFTLGMSAFETLLFGEKLWDINAQPTLFHRSLMDEWKKPPHDFALDLYAYCLACRHHCEIIRIPVNFPPRIHGQSNWNTSFAAKWKFIQRTFSFSLKLRKGLA